jgi:8-oxo-dGTP pyrophosphatase MutT (NUDIX family)
MDPHKLALFYDRLEACLKVPLPGFSAQMEMAPVPRLGSLHFSEKKGGAVPAGVLVLFFLRRNTLTLALTRRSDRLPIHQAQISFPGGRQEAEESLRQTALRETEEELGISTGDCRILGALTPLFIPPTNYCIHPTVAGMNGCPVFVPSEEEVAEVLELPLNVLLDKNTVRREEWTVRGIPVDVPFFYFEGHKIWGATAMVLSELVHVLRESCSAAGRD